MSTYSNHRQLIGKWFACARHIVEALPCSTGKNTKTDPVCHGFFPQALEKRRLVLDLPRQLSGLVFCDPLT